jgi:uncharacterized membrane protein HdeD (DUF308 family)
MTDVHHNVEHPFHHNLEHAFRRARTGLILRGLLALAFGVFALLRPATTVAVLALVVAFWALFTGIAGIVSAIDLRGEARHWWLVLIGGIISIAFGVAALIYFPTLSLAFLVIWLAWWLMLIGITEIATSIQEKRNEWPWVGHMILGIVAVFAAIIALLYPPATLAALIFWIGFTAILLGVVLLIAAANTKVVQRRVEARVSDRDRGEPPRAAA